ncbi:hypothetical protein DCO56_08585 [Sphingobacterium athyrii]|uniref:Uncharacterized protein n=1 Tax=Sphingobacterium athyrii TaxID=2152717 RepID=A0A363NW89_9SPHI|nr:hypothetical protein DCO56_08585 [Sphingobacterium athyrii]
MYERLKYLVSPLFIFVLFLLIINDFFLKAAFHNTFTGKLSDFSGLLFFPFSDPLSSLNKSYVKTASYLGISMERGNCIEYICDFPVKC